jgi:hypothetical protein
LGERSGGSLKKYLSQSGLLVRRSFESDKNQQHQILTKIEMNTQNQNGYMLLFRGNDWTKSLSPEEKQKVTDQWMAWFRRLTDQGKAIAGNPLEPEGKIVSGKNRVVSDGPFAESKEAIGGYFLLDVASVDDAVAIARECPGLPYGVQVEVRPVAAECPLASELKHEAQFANA